MKNNTINDNLNLRYKTYSDIYENIVTDYLINYVLTNKCKNILQLKN